MRHAVHCLWIMEAGRMKTTNSSQTSKRIEPRGAAAGLAGEAGVAAGRGAGLPLPEVSALPGVTSQLLLPPGMAQAGARRLVALVPEADSTESAWAALLWRLANPRNLPVLLVGVTGQPETQYRARRRLIDLAALTRADNVPVSVELLVEASWEEAARRFWRPGDLLICPAELRADGLLGHRRLAQRLVRRLGAPVYVLSGYGPARPEERWRLTRSLLGWVPPLLILVAFFWVQAQLTQATAGPLQTIALIGTVVVEFALIMLWERALSHL
jgi:hypothetical protein